MKPSPIYYTVNVFNENRFVMALDYTDKLEAIRESVAFQIDGFGTEFLTLSTAPMFESAPELIEDERIAY